MPRWIVGSGVSARRASCLARLSQSRISPCLLIRALRMKAGSIWPTMIRCGVGSLSASDDSTCRLGSFSVAAISSLIIRRACREDVAAIVAMLADDHLGRARERVEQPLPSVYYDAYARVASDSNVELVVAEEAGVVVGCLQLCILPGLSSQGASRALIEDVRIASSRRSR